MLFSFLTELYLKVKLSKLVDELEFSEVNISKVGLTA